MLAEFGLSGSFHICPKQKIKLSHADVLLERARHISLNRCRPTIRPQILIKYSSCHAIVGRRTRREMATRLGAKLNRCKATPLGGGGGRGRPGASCRSAAAVRDAPC